jgi:hypothetical protein
MLEDLTASQRAVLEPPYAGYLLPSAVLKHGWKILVLLGVEWEN